ncbi:MAG: hypothetical protein QOH70_1698 [Blastocatellia bacterium]|jgi:uncharacterized protein YjbI with pentapeptide repeats|nr:hypothetical protein [Blastocatellia bacterium]
MNQVEGYVAAFCQFRLSIDESYECSQPVYEENLCLFHTPKLSEADKQDLSEAERSSVKGVEKEFRERLVAFIAKKEEGSDGAIDIRGFQFPRMKFPSVSKPIDFTGCVFTQPIDFDRVEFKGKASFVFAQFMANSSFQSTAFRKEADFEQAIFGGVGTARITFLNAVFDGRVNFNGAEFAAAAQFSSASFGKDGAASFWDASFRSDATFIACVFGGHTHFRAKFHGDAFFGSSEFASEARFAGTCFDLVADFRRCKFSAAEFAETSFKGDALFEETQFRGSASFSHCHFAQLASYPGVTFEQGADFSDSKFIGEFIGYGSRYKERATFMLAEFSADTDLRTCVFEDRVDFMAASFAGPVRFSNSIFGGPVNFNHARFEAEVQFVNDKVDFSFNDEIDFRDLNIGSEGRLTFRNVNLERARFTNTDLDLATFSNVRWFSHRHRMAPWTSRGASLWDEFRLPKQPSPDDYESIAENYRQLVLNYEQKRDYETAESFHMGEMEMQRKKKGAGISSAPLRQLRQWSNAYWVYRISSHYGTSYGQAVLVLIFLLLFLALAFLYSGFRTTENGTTRVVEYNVISDSDHRLVSMKEWIRDYVAAISLCASILTFQKDRSEPATWVARFWLYIAVVVFTGQSAMILLALRRRFRR